MVRNNDFEEPLFHRIVFPFESFGNLILFFSQLFSPLGHFMASFQVSAFYESVPLTCSSNFRVTGNDVRDLRLASPGGHSTQRLISPIGHLRVASLNDHRVSSPSDSEIRVHSPSKFSFVSIIYRPDTLHGFHREFFDKPTHGPGRRRGD